MSFANGDAENLQELEAHQEELRRLERLRHHIETDPIFEVWKLEGKEPFYCREHDMAVGVEPNTPARCPSGHRCVMEPLSQDTRGAHGAR